FELSSAIMRETPRALPVETPENLRTVVGRCLDKDPASRYLRASEARAVLEAAERVVVPRQVPRHFPASVAMAGLAVAVLAAALLLILPLFHRKAQESSVPSAAIAPAHDLYMR